MATFTVGKSNRNIVLNNIIYSCSVYSGITTFPFVQYSGTVGLSYSVNIIIIIIILGLQDQCSVVKRDTKSKRMGKLFLTFGIKMISSINWTKSQVSEKLHRHAQCFY